MLSVIIPTRNSDRILVPMLSALVPGATAGIITEVLVADAGSQDETAAVADIAGCNLIVAEGPLGRRLKAAAGKARAPWLMFLQPGTVLDAPWTGEVERFVQQPARYGQAAVFRRGGPAASTLREIMARLATMLGGLARPEQGLLISSNFYAALGGHSDRVVDSEHDLLRRIGRARTVKLATYAFAPPDTG
jgi:glycosyltransferase involved in cell wall biosynthesis